MAEEAATTAATEQTTTTTETTETTEEQHVPYERFQQVNKKAKDAGDRAKALEKQMADLQAQMEEREQAGLPELERERKRAEQLEKRAAEAEKRAEQQEQAVQRAQRERLVTNAAREFADPDDVVAILQRRGEFDDIETAQDAERVIKRIAKEKPHLLKAEDPKLPGRVLQDGRAPTKDSNGERKSDIDSKSEASMIAKELAKFRDRWTTVE